MRPPTDRVIRSLGDVHEAVAWYVDQIPADRVLSVATHVSTDISFRAVHPEEMERALTRRSEAGPTERDVYASYLNEVFLTAFEQRCADRVVFQFSLGAEPLPFETGSRLSQRTIAQLADIRVVIKIDGPSAAFRTNGLENHSRRSAAKSVAPQHAFQ